MPSERIQRRIEAFLDQAEAASDGGDWQQVAEKARAVLAIDAENEDAADFLRMAAANGVAEEATAVSAPRQLVGASISVEEPARSVIEATAIVEQIEAAATEDANGAGTPETHSDPTEFAAGRYQVLRFLGEGGKKRVFLAHDTLLERDIAFSLIKTDGLDDVGRERITREAQAMGRLAHQNIVAIYDIGEHTAADGSKQPFLVQELMGGGDVEDLLADASGPLSLAQALEIAIATARGLEFAHAQQVIHRDLKPGNVWLTADGVAKIGDLGLAVTLGQTRLTDHGMMVGTYGYMPPEQALGHEVTPQADLYSLGAMLYELVTGRPPFEGDTPTAVISQHLNSQPVAPSWRSAHCPPDLEALILQLLAKAPADRPESASAVLAALEAVDPEGQSASHSESGANPLDRLARGVFVGRTPELSQLRDGLDAAIAGRGSVAMLVGQPGIGKTRTVQELETYARMRGANVYWGRTHESAGMPAYWPWLQIGRAWGAQQDFGAAAVQGAVANPELVRLFPELRAQIPTLPEPQEHRDPESAQFLLFEAYTQFVRAQATQTPWVIVLDDLHWADKPTLQLLQFMARELANMPVLIVATYRDTDLVRTHPLSEALAELNREGGFRRVVLKGLDADEVASYVRQRASVEPSPALLDRVYEETEGNPFFLSEVVNLLVQEDTLDSDSVSDIALPDGVREALGRRLDRLSPEANELLQVAAVVGREFAYETLALLDEDRTDDALLGILEDALEARVIEESDRPARYQFTHALMQETLLDELSTMRRVRLHGRVADALVERFGDDTSQVSQLARHYRESSVLGPEHVSKAFKFSLSAAASAVDRAAWAEAATQYQYALQLVPENAPTAEQARIRVGYGRALYLSGDAPAGFNAVESAQETLLAVGDLAGVTSAAISLNGLAPGVVNLERWNAMLDRAIVAASVDQPYERAVVLVMKATITAGGVTDESKDAAADEARAIVTRESYDDLEARLQVRDAMVLAPSDRSASFKASLVAKQHLEAVGDQAGVAQALWNASYTAPSFDDFVELALEGAERCYALGQQREGDRASWFLAMSLLFARADFDGAAAAMGHSPGSYSAALVRSLAYHLQGDFDAAIKALPDADDPVVVSTYRPVILLERARIDLAAGRSEDARSLALEAFRESHGPLDYHITALCPELIGEYLGTVELRRRLERLDEFVSRIGLPSDQFWHCTVPARAHGHLALLDGDNARAKEQYTSALEAAERDELPVEAGRCHQGLAEVEERRGNVEAAREHLDAAGELFSRHGAKLYLDQVIAKKEILKA